MFAVERQYLKVDRFVSSVIIQKYIINFKRSDCVKIAINRCYGGFSLTDNLIDKIKFEKWDGVLPQVQSGGATIVDVTSD